MCKCPIGIGCIKSRGSKYILVQVSTPLISLNIYTIDYKTMHQYNARTSAGHEQKKRRSSHLAPNAVNIGNIQHLQGVQLIQHMVHVQIPNNAVPLSDQDLPLYIVHF